MSAPLCRAILRTSGRANCGDKGPTEAGGGRAVCDDCEIGCESDMVVVATTAEVEDGLWNGLDGRALIRGILLVEAAVLCTALPFSP